jgi:hypothetical protein
MEQRSYQNSQQQAQEQIQDGLTTEILSEFTGEDHVIWLNEVEAKYGFDTDKIHPETLRALCHYAAVATGEITDTAVLFRRVSKLQGEGYAQREVATYEFIVTQRAQPLEIKREITYEKRPTQTNHGTNNSAPAIRNNHTRSSRMPDQRTNRLTKRTGF